MKRHTPTPEEIREAVIRAFKADRAAVLSDSKKKEDVLPREVIAYLMSTRGALDPQDIMKETGYNQVMVYKCIRVVRGWIRWDSDFAFKVWEAEKMILGIKEKVLISNP